MIDPTAVSTIRVGELSPEPFSLTDKIPHEVGTELKRGSIEDLATFISSFIGSTDGVGFRAISVTDGQTLPTTTQQEFILVGKGTYYNVVGGSTIICTEELNAIVSNGSYWFIGVEIPINVELAGITQFIRDGFISTTPSEDAVYDALALKANVADSEDVTNKVSTISTYSTTLYPNEKATHDALNLKLNISDLPTNLTLYPTNVASDVSGYIKMVTDIHAPDYNVTAVDVSTPAITGTGQLVSQRIADAGVLIGQPGVFNFTTFGNIRRLSGSGTAEFYTQAYHRDSLGVETLVGTSSPSAVVVNGTYAEFTTSGVWDDGEFAPTDRIVIKSYANRIAGGSDPIYQFQFGGTTPVRTLLPVPFSVVDAGYELKANKQNDLTIDGTGTKYPTVDAVNTGLANINKIVNASDYGFSPTATASANSAALNDALLGGNKTVIITKPGTYLVNSTVWIDDYTNLIFEKGVTIKKASNYVIVFGNRGALTRTTNTNIKIQGCRIITDGYQSSFGVNDPLYGLLGNISFFHINNLEIIDTEILDIPSANWAIQICTFNNVHVDGFVLKGQKDGVHLGRGKNFLVENGVTETFDDAVALNGHDYTNCNPEVGNIEDGIIRNITDLYKSPTTGYFSRHLIGAWVDWYSGIQLQKGDAIVNGGKTYRIEGTAGVSYNSAIFPTIPVGQNSVVAPEGFTLIFCSNDAVYSANMVNIKYENIKTYSNRVTLRAELDLGSSFNRSIHPTVPISDYPSVEISVKNLLTTATTKMLVLPDNIYSNIILDNCTTSGELIYAGLTSTLKSKIAINRCDFRNILSGNVMTFKGSDVIISNSISDSAMPVFFGTGSRARTTDNITSTTFSLLSPLRGDYFILDNVSKVYNGTIWVDQDVLIMGNTTTGYLPKSNGASLTNSIAFENITGIGIGTATATDKLDVNGGTIIGVSGSRLHLNTNSFAYNRNVNTGAMFNASAYGYQWQKTNNATQGSDYLALQVYNTIGGNVTNSAFVINGFGNIGLRTTSPTARLHLPTGTNLANTAPLKFNSGTLMTTPEIGSIEFLDDRWYGTITTGVARKTFAFLENPAFTGTPTAPTAPVGTSNEQIANTAFVQGVARPYKVYTAILTQVGTDAPTAIVLENTIGSIVWSRTIAGAYFATLTGAFITDKTTVLITNGSSNGTYIHGASVSTSNVSVVTSSDGQIDRATIEIRVYN